MNEAWLRRTCQKWPGVTFDVKWDDDFCALVAGKMFAVVDAKARASSLCIKVPADRFLELTDQEGIEPAPYVARYKWVKVTEPERFEQAWLREATRTSYELIRDKLPKKVRATLAG